MTVKKVKQYVVDSMTLADNRYSQHIVKTPKYWQLVILEMRKLINTPREQWTDKQHLFWQKMELVLTRIESKQVQ